MVSQNTSFWICGYNWVISNLKEVTFRLVGALISTISKSCSFNSFLSCYLLNVGTFLTWQRSKLRASLVQILWRSCSCYSNICWCYIWEKAILTWESKRSTKERVFRKTIILADIKSNRFIFVLIIDCIEIMITFICPGAVRFFK